MVFVSFGGLTKVASMAEEVRNPGRTIPLGMFLAFGVVCGLLESQRSGEGQVVDAAMVDGAGIASLLGRHVVRRSEGDPLLGQDGTGAVEALGATIHRTGTTVEIDGVAADPWGGERVALTARGEIDREDFGLTWNVALESGGVLVSKKVVLEIEAQAVRTS